jgi:hypothetical protein
MATTVEPVEASPSSLSPTRSGRISSLVARIQPIDARNTFQVALGAFLVPLGLLIILISWYGAAHTAYVQQQIPYLVSGSFIGLGLMILGGLLYWAHWLYRIYDQADQHHAAANARQEELIERLIDALGATGSAAVGSVVEASGGALAAANGSRRPRVLAAEAIATEGFVATASGANVHRPDCPIVIRHSVGLRRLSLSEATERPRCRICQPVVG